VSEACPKCKSTDISGLIQAFWIGLDKNGNFIEPRSIRSEAELGEERLCNKCGHEWKLGDSK
jgi:hypothetical protein